MPNGAKEIPMFRFQIRILAAAMALAAASVSAETNVDPSGVWLTETGDAKIHVSKCGSGLCGIIIWLKTPIDPATGRPQVDDKNRDPALAHRPLIGIDIFKGMKSVTEHKWSGRIYNADDGKTYSSDVTLAGPRKLEVRGCVMAVLCGGETWTKLVGVADAD
jgi:uncharacterized protein (DUF2147 family)